MPPTALRCRCRGRLVTHLPPHAIALSAAAALLGGLRRGWPPGCPRGAHRQHQIGRVCCLHAHVPHK
eukprot:365630-Chlamydomonas_euryale.AAC.5